MKIINVLIGIILTVSLSAASAQTSPPSLTAKNDKGNIVVHLLLNPCQKPVLDIIKLEFQKVFREAREVINGKEIKACWIESEGIVYLINENNELGEIPTEAFKPSDMI